MIRSFIPSNHRRHGQLYKLGPSKKPEDDGWDQVLGEIITGLIMGSPFLIIGIMVLIWG